MAKSNNTTDKNIMHSVNALDKIAHKLLSTFDSSFSERRVISKKDERIQKILEDNLTLTKGISNGSIIDFVASMTSSKTNHQHTTSISDADPSEIFTQNVNQIFGYFEEMYKNRYIELADLKFIAKFIPALGEAVKTTIDSIVSSDDITSTITRNLSLPDSLTDEEKTSVESEINRFEKEEKLLKNLRNIVYKKAVITGNHYVYCPPYKELFEEYDRLLKAGKINNGIIVSSKVNPKTARMKSGFNLSTESAGEAASIQYEPVVEAVTATELKECLEKSNLFEAKEIDAMTKELDTIGFNITVNNCPYMSEAIETFAAIDASEAANDYYSDSLKGYSKAFGGITKLNEKFYGYSDGTKDVNEIGKRRKSKFDTKGTYIKYIDAAKIVPVKVYNQIVGYFHIHDTSATKKAKSLKGSGDNMLMGSVNLFTNISLSETKKNDAVKLIVDTISDGILSNFSNKFVNNNSEYKRLIADCIVANGLINNNLQIQFIPANHIVPFIINEQEDGFGESVLADSLFPGRLLLNLIISKMLLYMNKSGNKTMAFVRKGPIDVSSQNHVQRVLRQMQETTVTFSDLLSTNLSFAKFAPYGNIQIPTSKSGDRLIDFEVQEGQQIEMKPEFEDWLEKMAIMGTGVPSVILEYTDAADYSRSIVTANIKFAGRIATYQSDLEEATTELYKHILMNGNLPDQIKNKLIQSFEFKLPRPRVITNTNLSEYISTIQTVASGMSEIVLGQDTGNDPDYQLIKDEFIRQTAIASLPFINWDEAMERVENAKLEIAKKKPLDEIHSTPTNSSDLDTEDDIDGGDDDF